MPADWFPVSNHTSADGIGVEADEVAQELLPILLQQWPQRGISKPLAELPIQLIGHSRGASVIAALAKNLGERGIWIQQLTTGLLLPGVLVIRSRDLDRVEDSGVP